MAVTESTMMELGRAAPSFSLPAANPDVDDRERDGTDLARRRHDAVDVE